MAAGEVATVGTVSWSLEVLPEERAAAMAQAGHRTATGDRPYLLPHHANEPAEIDRLDVQHFALREHLGTNHLAPLEQPAWILDVGCGTGLWAYDLCAEFPDARVVGLDLVPSKRPWPAAYRLVRGNLLQGLPFADGRFDFVHQRFLMAGVPVKSWQVVVQDLVRTTRPGGWVELVEGTTDFEPAGAATGRLAELAQRLGRTRGLDSTGIVFRSVDSYLTRAGMADVERRTVPLPLGEWGGRIGSLMATDFRSAYVRVAALFEAHFGVSERELRELVAAAQEEWEELHTTYHVAIAFGRKPG